jgi:hypothetical protein
MPSQAEISLNPTSAKGDILSFDGSSRVRVGVGSNGTILTSQSSASSGIEYKTFTGDAGQRFYLISTGTATASTTFELSNIPQTFSDLLLIFSANSSSGDDSTAGPQISISMNTSSTASLTSMVVEKKGQSTGSDLNITVAQGTSTSNLVEVSGLGGSGHGYLNSSQYHMSTIEIPFYTSTTKRKMMFGYRNSGRPSNFGRLGSQFGKFVIGSNITSAITSIKFTATTHNIIMSRYYLYGIRNGDI